MSGRLSAVIGPALWGLTIWALSETGELAYRVALATLAIFLVAGLLILRGVKVTREDSDLDAIDGASIRHSDESRNPEGTGAG